MRKLKHKIYSAAQLTRLILENDDERLVEMTKNMLRNNYLLPIC